MENFSMRLNVQMSKHYTKFYWLFLSFFIFSIFSLKEKNKTENHTHIAQSFLTYTYECVKNGWFGRQVAVCLNKRHTNAYFGFSRFQKFNFDCLLFKILICSSRTEKYSASFVLFGLIQLALFKGLIYIHITLSFWPPMKNYEVKNNSSFTHLFHDAKKLRRKPKTFMKVKQRFWNVQHMYDVNI